MLRLLYSYKLWCVVFLFYALYVLRFHVLFEIFLRSSVISLFDFPASYRAALDASLKDDAVLQYDKTLLVNASDANKIPPTIHFIWFKDLYEHHLDRSDHDTEISHSGSDAPESCKYTSPGFDVITWNASAAHELIATHYAGFLSLYESYRYPIQKVDAFKYFVLHHHGGIYMDLDISCRRPLWPFLRYPAWFPKADLQGVNNDVFAARKGHPLLERMMQRLEARNWNLIFPYLTVYWSTGPQFVNDILAEWWDEKHAGSDTFFILPLSLYSQHSPYFGHHIGGTWHGNDVAVILWLVDRPWLVLLLVAALVLPLIAIATARSRRQGGFKVM